MTAVPEKVKAKIPEDAKWIEVLTLHESGALPLMLQMTATVAKAMEEVYGTGNVLIELKYGTLVVTRLETEEETDKRVEQALRSAKATIEYENDTKKKQEELAKELGVTVEELVESQKKVRGY